jgi:vacuolar-type H+-ATPase subunit H
MAGTSRGRAHPIDIIFLVERLEALIANGKKVPLTNNVVVDQTASLDLIDQLRVAVPEEVRQAKRINQEGERILERAQEEADRIIGRAQEQAAFLIEERELTRAAEIRSQQLIEEGTSQAEEIRRGADAYAAKVLIQLEGDIVRALQSIKRGIAMLDERRPVDVATLDYGEEEPEQEYEQEPELYAAGPGRAQL